ncbi:MAG: hypothetical protein R6W78_03540 [Bacteroidales bacterium]
MKSKLLIFPFSGSGFEALDCLTDRFECIGFVDDDTEKQGRNNQFGIEVFDRQAFSRYKDAMVLAVPGSPVSYTNRDKLIQSLGIPESRFATIIHPKASVSAFSFIGFNVLIMENVVIKATAVIGNHVCILPNSTVHHDSKIHDFSLIGSNVTIAGNTIIGTKCYIGSGSNIINKIHIGNGTLVGLGSNVVKPVSDNSKIAGNPAQQI